MSQPIFAQVPESKLAKLTAAYNDRTGNAAGLVELLTAATNGTKVTQIAAKTSGNQVASSLLIFITDTAGANPTLFDEIILPAVTASNTLPSSRNVAMYDDLQLKDGQKIMVGATVYTSPINVIAQAGDF